VELFVSKPELTQARALNLKHSPRLIPERHATVWVTRKFDVSPEQVFDAWLDPGVAGKWLFATASRPMTRVTIDARIGGAFCFVDRNDGEHVEHGGVYLEIERPWRLVFTLSTKDDPQSPTRVTAEIIPRGDGCELAVAHEQVPMEQLGRVENRWTGMLYGLGETLN
jgi:uncharacterized protein YndB with AHSA1/START domain